MGQGRYQFDIFTLDEGDRRLCRDGQPVELSNRYFDALALLLRQRGQLVPKDRFMGEVWHGVPVTDEALTQCMRSLRRALGDDAANPRFIETVPKHGYRFIAPVRIAAVRPTSAGPVAGVARRRIMLIAAGMAGGGVAGVLGGLVYGFTLNLDATGPGIGQAGMGATSVLFVLLAINMLVGLIGGTGVGIGLALSDAATTNRAPWSIAGGAAGGFMTGALAKLVGLDAFRLLFGQAPGDMTGAFEGALLGAAVGFAVWLARRYRSGLARSMLWGGSATGLVGLLISLLGGRLLGGSLDLLLHRFPNAHFRLDRIGLLFGEAGFGPISGAVTGGLEGILFGACMAGAIHLARELDGAPIR